MDGLVLHRRATYALSVSESLAVEDWCEAGEVLVMQAWVRLASAIRDPLVARLIDCKRPPWHPLPPEEGVVQQSGFGSYLAVTEAEQVVREVASSLTISLSLALSESGVPPLPEFNEVTWTRYPAGTGHISAHRDPFAYGGVIAVATLTGSATFRAWGASGVAGWRTEPGDIVVMQGAGWPTADSRGPLHEVEPPIEGERIIMTLRHNTRGAGGGYDL